MLRTFSRRLLFLAFVGSNMMPTSKASSQPDSCVQLADRLGLAVAASKGANFVFSPLSLCAALSLAASGSNGTTRDEFLSFLRSDTIDNLKSAAEELMAAVRPTAASAPDPTSWMSNVSSVNNVWVDKTVTLTPSFKEMAVSVYGAEVGEADFKNKAQEEGKRINEWVESKTNELIKDLIPGNQLSELTRIVLINALYFKGQWLSKFSATRDRDFHLLDGATTARAPFMSNGDDHYIALFDGFRVLKLRYEADPAGRKFSMLILLPDKVDGLNRLVKEAVSAPGFFERHTPTELVKTGRFAVPKFNISSGFDPSRVLQEMGLRAAFDPDKAQFEEMVYPSHENPRLFISAVRHKATIEVDENGTEAAAATIVEFGLTCSMPGFEEPRPTVDFVADHPFMFVIREEDSGAVLFMGHVVNPLLEDSTIN